jgi:hypothetical protein
MMMQYKRPELVDKHHVGRVCLLCMNKRASTLFYCSLSLSLSLSLSVRACMKERERERGEEEGHDQ